MEPVRYTSITDLTVESIKELIQSDEDVYKRQELGRMRPFWPQALQKR